MKKISKSVVQNLAIVTPHMAVQRAIVAKLDALHAETKRLESLYQRKLAALDELKQSLLARAFAGEL